MSPDDLEDFLRALGLTVERVTDSNATVYTVAREVDITTGGLRGTRCDVAIQRVETNPYVVPSAIHTRPVLVPMGGAPLNTSQSPIGPDWQYWSRRFDHTPTPRRIWAHILTVLGDPRWSPA
jgi:Prokaryotic E2 family E